MVVLHICKNEEDLMKNEDAILLTRLYVVFSDAQGQLTPKSAVEICLNSNSSKLLVFLVTCKNEENPIKNEGARVLTSLLFDFSDAQGQLTPKSAVEFHRNSNSSKL